MAQIGYLSKVETAKQLGVSRVTLDRYIREGKLPGASKKGVPPQAVENLRNVFESQKKISKKALQGSISQVHRSLQYFFGGSTTDGDWLSTAAKKVNLKREAFELSQIRKSFFVDTVVYAVPAVYRIEILKGKKKAVMVNGAETQRIPDGLFWRDKPKDSQKSKIRKEQKEQLAKDLGLEDIGESAVNVPLHGCLIFANDWNCDTAVCLTASSNVPAQFIQGKEYYGYQFYRYTTSDLHPKIIFRMQHPKHLGQPCFIVRMDITANFPGFVRCFGPDDAEVFAAKGLEIKDNKRFVGNHCHTFICRDELATYFSPLTKDLTDTEYLALLATTTEISTASSSIEVKIYDKIRYMLEVGQVGADYSNHALKYFYISQKPEIVDALNQYSHGFSRIELRLRGPAITNVTEGLALTALRFYAKTLCGHFSYEEDSQSVINRFLSTVHANVAIQREDTEGRLLDFRVSQWVNILTGQIQGKVYTGAEATVRYNTWIDHMSNRQVPLVLAFIKSANQNHELRKIEVWPPMSPRKGLPRLLEGNTAKEQVSHPFDLPFVLSKAQQQSTKPRLAARKVSCQDYNAAKKVVRKFNYRNNQSRKSIERKTPDDEGTIKKLWQAGNIKYTKVSSYCKGVVGYLFYFMGHWNFVSIQKNGKALKVLVLPGQVKVAGYSGLLKLTTQRVGIYYKYHFNVL